MLLFLTQEISDGNEDRLLDVMNDPMPFEAPFRFRTKDNKFQLFRLTCRGDHFGEERFTLKGVNSPGRYMLVKTLKSPVVQIQCCKHMVRLGLLSGRILGNLAPDEDERFGALQKRVLSFVKASKQFSSFFTEPEKIHCKFVAVFPKKKTVHTGFPLQGHALNRKVMKTVRRRKVVFAAGVIKNPAP